MHSKKTKLLFFTEKLNVAHCIQCSRVKRYLQKNMLIYFIVLPRALKCWSYSRLKFQLLKVVWCAWSSSSADWSVGNVHWIISCRRLSYVCLLCIRTWRDNIATFYFQSTLIASWTKRNTMIGNYEWKREMKCDTKAIIVIQVILGS